MNFIIFVDICHLLLLRFWLTSEINITPKIHMKTLYTHENTMENTPVMMKRCENFMKSWKLQGDSFITTSFNSRKRYQDHYYYSVNKNVI